MINGKRICWSFEFLRIAIGLINQRDFYITCPNTEVNNVNLLCRKKRKKLKNIVNFVSSMNARLRGFGQDWKNAVRTAQKQKPKN